MVARAGFEPATYPESTHNAIVAMTFVGVRPTGRTTTAPSGHLKELGFDLKTTMTTYCLKTSSSLKNFTEVLTIFVQYNRDICNKK